MAKAKTTNAKPVSQAVTGTTPETIANLAAFGRATLEILATNQEHDGTGPVWDSETVEDIAANAYAMQLADVEQAPEGAPRFRLIGWTFNGTIPADLIAKARAEIATPGLCRFINYDRDDRTLYVSSFFTAGEENNFTVARVTASTVDLIPDHSRPWLQGSAK